LTIDLLTAFIIAAVTALVVVLVMRSIAARQVAETRAASIAELAATKQDLKWVREDAERKAQALDSAQTLLDNTEKRLRDTFQALAADALKDNRASFLDLAKTSFQNYQQPIAESLNRVDQRLREAERERVEAYSRLSEQVVALGSTANTLSRALRTPAVRGRWGEMQLRRVVEIAGMLQRCDFDEQPGVTSDNGRLRPDLIVHLPGGKQIVVDAKTPLDAFLDAQE
jgi:DNA recombination protein RmuC